MNVSPPIYGTEIDSQRADLWLPKGKSGGVGWTGSLGSAGGNDHVGRGINEEALLDRIGSYVQCPGWTVMKGNVRGGRMCIIF